MSTTQVHSTRSGRLYKVKPIKPVAPPPKSPFPRSTRSIALVLIGSVTVFFGFKSCLSEDEDYTDYATTQPSSGTGAHYYGAGNNSNNHSHRTGVSRHGFGHSGHSVGA